MATKAEFASFMATMARAIPKFAPNLQDASLLDVWYGELGALGTDELSYVYKQAVRSFDQFPSIRQTLELAGRTEQSEEDKAREVAERIWNTICRKGSQKFNLADYVGAIGVEVVRIQGGWERICEIATYDNAPTLKAQWREIAEVLVRKDMRGERLDALPQFRDGRQKIDGLVSGLLSEMEKKGVPRHDK